MYCKTVETMAEGAVSRRAVMGVMVRVPVRVLVLCVGFVVASLQCTIICWLVLIVAVRIPTLRSLYCAVVVMVMDYI